MNFRLMNLRSTDILLSSIDEMCDPPMAPDTDDEEEEVGFNDGPEVSLQEEGKEVRFRIFSCPQKVTPCEPILCSIM
jgi:hypothetical protein